MGTRKPLAFTNILTQSIILAIKLSPSNPAPCVQRKYFDVLVSEGAPQRMQTAGGRKATISSRYRYSLAIALPPPMTRTAGGACPSSPNARHQLSGRPESRYSQGNHNGGP